MYRMDVHLLGADPSAPVIKEEQQDYYEQYYQDYNGLKGAVAHAYSKITYRDVYPGIDWVLYIKARQMAPNRSNTTSWCARAQMYRR